MNPGINKESASDLLKNTQTDIFTPYNFAKTDEASFALRISITKRHQAMPSHFLMIGQRIISQQFTRRLTKSQSSEPRSIPSKLLG